MPQTMSKKLRPGLLHQGITMITGLSASNDTLAWILHQNLQKLSASGAAPAVTVLLQQETT